MKAFFWNIRGFGARGHRNQLRTYCSRERPDIICLQETIKQPFTLSELDSLVAPHAFTWVWHPAVGLLGGLLTGVNSDLFEVLSSSTHRFFICISLRTKADNFSWDLFNVYGPANHSLSAAFLAELNVSLQSSTFPILIGGDFNLLRTPSDKNNPNFSWLDASNFNAVLNAAALCEIPRVGARFTCSNHQASPVRCVLDRVLMSPDWELHFPRVSLLALPAVGSDHSALLVSSGLFSDRPTSRFRFESSWFLRDDFIPLVTNKWISLCLDSHRSFSPLDDWRYCSQQLRRFLRGWGLIFGPSP